VLPRARREARRFGLVIHDTARLNPLAAPPSTSASHGVTSIA